MHHLIWMPAQVSRPTDFKYLDLYKNIKCIKHHIITVTLIKRVFAKVRRPFLIFTNQITI